MTEQERERGRRRRRRGREIQRCGEKGGEGRVEGQRKERKDWERGMGREREMGRERDGGREGVGG